MNDRIFVAQTYIYMMLFISWRKYGSHLDLCTCGLATLERRPEPSGVSQMLELVSILKPLLLCFKRKKGLVSE